MSILKDLTELVQQNLISNLQADEIVRYYENKRASQPNRLSMILATLGAVFIGLAIILILGHNWDGFSIKIRVVMAVFPLLAAQILVIYTLIKKADNTIWKETAGIVLFFAFAATVFIISQIYNISDPAWNFYVLWVVLCIPIVYILDASVLSLLCIGLITMYIIAHGFNSQHILSQLYYYISIVALIPYYILFLRKNPGSNAASWFQWMIVLSLVLATFTLGAHGSFFLIFTFMALFSFFYNLGKSSYFEGRSGLVNAFKQMGQVGIAIVLIVGGFYGFWDDVLGDWLDEFTVFSGAFIAGFIYSIVSVILYLKRSVFNPKHLLDLDLVLLPFIIIFFTHTSFSALLCNVLGLATGISILLRGVREDQLLTINFGLFIIATLILSRFFESDLSYLIRGIVFAVLGLAFFFTNYYLTRKSKMHEK